MLVGASLPRVAGGDLRARGASRSAVAGSSACRIPAASSCTDPGGTSTAASSTSSSIAEPDVVTSVAPQANASTLGRPKPSAIDG